MDANWFATPGPEDTGWEGRCNALKKDGSRRCRLQAGMRTDHVGVGPCWCHAGNAPGVRLRYARQQAAVLLNGYGLLREGVVDPRDLLMEELARTAGTVDYLTAVIGELTEEQLLGQVPIPVEVSTGADEKGESWKVIERVGIPVVLEHYRWERTQLAKLSTDAVKLGLLERAIVVEAAQVTLVAAATSRALERMALQPEQLQQAKALLREELAALETTAG